MFFASYCAPQLLHAVAHELSHTDHVEFSFNPDARAEFETPAAPACEFLAILGAHSIQFGFNNSFVAQGDLEPSTASVFFHRSAFVERLDGFAHRARGPPTIV